MINTTEFLQKVRVKFNDPSFAFSFEILQCGATEFIGFLDIIFSAENTRLKYKE